MTTERAGTEESLAPDVLASFASDLLFELIEDGGGDSGPQRLQGTLLLSDIAGFTTLVEELNTLGRVGIEVFNDGMRRYMDGHVRAVRDAGGDVLGLAGDSFLCFWRSDGSEAGNRAAAVAASSTGLVLQERFRGFMFDDERPLRMRVGVASGEVQVTLVGGVAGAYEILTEGETVAAVTVAERDCPEGAVAIDRATAAVLGSAARVAPLTDALVELDHVAAPEVEPVVEAVRRTADPAVVAAQAPRLALAMGGTDPDTWQPEFRRLSIALALVPGLGDYGAEVAQEVVASFQRTLRRFDADGWLTFDGKGAIFVATLGAPPAAHEDDPHRAVRHAVDFAEEVRALGVDIGVGVATGQALHGIAGNRQRRAVTIAGEVVNVAARLAASSTDTVLVDHETATRSSARFTFTVMNSIQVKGKHERVPVFRPVERVDEVVGRGVVLRGRDNEIEAAARCLRGEGSDLLVLVGAAGVGKSAIGRGAIDDVRRDGARPIVVRADSMDLSSPYAAWVGALRVILDVDRGADARRIISRAQEILEPDLAGLAPVLADVLGVTIDADLPELGREERAGAIAAVLVALVVDVAEAPALVVEDAHWCDTASWQVVSQLLDRPDHPPVLVTTRPGEERIDKIAAQHAAEIVELGMLDRQAVHAMVSDRIGGEAPAGLVQFVHARTSGHPFYCDELVKNLMEDGLVRAGGGGVTVGHLDETLVPSTVEGVVVSRFDRLDRARQQCMKAAAVVGADIDPAAVDACLAADQGVLLGSLVETGMLQWAGDVGRLEFSHVIARDVIYGLMTTDERARLHGAVASHLEGSAEPDARALGHHWLEAGDHQRAARHLEVAAASSLRVGSLADARALFGTVEELLDPADTHRLALLRMHKATASYYLGDLPQVVSDLEAAIAVVDTPLPAPDAEGPPRRGLFRGRRAKRDDWRVDDVAEDLRLPLLESYERLTMARYLLGRPPAEMLVCGRRAVRLAEAVGKTDAEALSASILAGVTGMTGDFKTTERLAQRAVDLVDSGRADATATDVWRTLAVTWAGQGRWAEALDACDRADATLTEESRNRSAGTSQTRAAILLCAGDFDRAEPAWQRAAAIGEAIGNQRQVYWSRLDEVQTRIGQDRVAEAGAVLRRLERDLGEPADPMSRIEHQFSLALVESANGRYDEAVAAGDRVLEMIEAAPPSGFHWVEFCSGAVEVFLAALPDSTSGASAAAELAAKTEHAIDVLERLSASFLHVRPRVPLARGLLAARTGDLARATQLLDEAAAMAASAELRFDAARALVLRETFAPSLSTTEVQAAIEDLDQLGAARWATRARALLR